MNQLKPCPFCGSNDLDVKRIQHSQNEAVYCVRCLGECECEGPVEFTRDDAKQKWNTRTEVERLRAERRWIPVEEQLPETEEEVATLWYNGFHSVARLYKGRWSSGARVTHWMPLPPLPEKEVQG